MKFSAVAGELSEALRTVALAVTDSTIGKLQSLSCVRIATMGATASFMVHALDHCISADCVVEVEHDGAVAVSAQRLAKLAAGLTAKAAVMLTAQDGMFELRSGWSVYKLPTVPLLDLPAVPTINPELGQLELSHEEVLDALTVPLFCAGDDGTRFYLSGLCLHHTESGMLAAVSTDGVRLARLLMPVAPTTRLTDDRRVIIPLASITPLIRILKKSSGTVQLRRSKNLIGISTTSFEFISRLIDGTFPAYECLIPEQASLPNSATLDRAELASALTRMSAVVDSKIIFPLAGFEWEAGATTLRLSLLKQPEAATELLDAELTGGCRIAIALPKMCELTEELKGEKLRVEVNGMGAVKFTVPSDDRITVLQMPTAWEFGEQQTETA